MIINLGKADEVSITCKIKLSGKVFDQSLSPDYGLASTSKFLKLYFFMD
jgi:hypothetical protein